MFNGLIREIAKVEKFQNNHLFIQSSYIPKIGDSIAINGTCLTAVEIFAQGFCVELSTHTQAQIAVENLDGYVHIEPALQMQDRIDGHFIQGHIDAIGTITQIQTQTNQTLFKIATPPSIAHLIIPKGSIALDGVSLTIADFSQNLLSVIVIPHTLHNTLFATYTPKRRINIETDMIVRSIAHIIHKSSASKDWKHFDAITLGY
ncbi:riboflavin synthase subunit alpha [Helicobacter enhydrae]|uniref:Riboflavin synthase n=1 Tax=Helicobacter enhydrae TaxID=222136 RepID=A0A1B1U4A8_9HELI|nr:riboflavin synthase [Helicobacter enhydrae]ANV97586.1 riboflavin synthase subunit alpha [Helicobacter enhydrae]